MQYIAFISISILSLTNAFNNQNSRARLNINKLSINRVIRSSPHHELKMWTLDSIGPTLTSLSVIAGVTAFHEAGHFLAAKSQGMTVQSFNVGYGPKLISFNDTSDTEFALRLLPLGGYVAFPNNVYRDEEGEVTGENPDPNLLQNRPPLQRALVISGGVLANILLTIILSTGVASTAGLARPVYNNGILVTSRTADSPGTRAGIQVNDRIISINNEVIGASSVAVNEFVAKVRNTPENQLVELNIMRPSADGSEKLIQVQVNPDRMSQGKASIGIGVAASVKETMILKGKNILDSINLGVQETMNIFQTTWSSLKAAVSTGFVGAEIGGPISIIKVGATVAKYDPFAIIGFASFLSINLAILNALPLPALDGGQFVFVLIELITGRKIPRDIQDNLIGLAFSFLLAVAVTTIVGDLTKVTQPLEMVPKQIVTTTTTTTTTTTNTVESITDTLPK